MDLIDAFSILAADDPRLTLAVVGSIADPTYGEAVAQRITQLGLTGKVELLGFVDDARLKALLSDAKVYCSLSLSESFGIPAVEAQLRGTPVVVANCCAPPHIVGAGGLLVEPRDVPGAARALRTLLYDRATWTDCSKAARANALEYEWRRCSQPLIDYLEQHSEST